MEYTFSISTVVVADSEDEAYEKLRSMISIPMTFDVMLTDKYDPQTDESWHYNDYYGWELAE